MYWLKRGMKMFNIMEYVSVFQKEGVSGAEKYRINNAPKGIFKFMPFYDRGNPEVNMRNIETLSERKVWSSKYYSLNDPYEFNGMYLDEMKIINSGNNIETFNKYKKYINDSFLITSFCVEGEIHPLNNMPMWAYYGNNHHGICVEYEVVDPISLYPVSYEGKRNPMTSVLGNFVTLALDAMSGKISPQNPDLLKYQFLMLNLMCVKHCSWKQENEFRILYPITRLEENGKRLSDKEMGIKMKAIYIGKDCSIRNKKKLMDIATGLKIEKYQMSVNEHSSYFDMCFDSVTNR
jgi:hypothetical protein